MAFTRTFNETVLRNVTTMNCEAARAGFRTNGPEKAVRITGVNRENRDRIRCITWFPIYGSRKISFRSHGAEVIEIL
jgi:hypothetical protein